MAIYTCLDLTTIQNLLRRFGITGVTGYFPMEGGSENTNYCVETGSGRYVLTLCDQKSLAHTTNLAKLLVYLTDQGVRTSRVVAPHQADAVILHQRIPVMLKGHIEGGITANLTGNLLSQLGEEMARLHAIPAPSYLPEFFPYGSGCFNEVIDSNLDHAYISWLGEKVRYLQDCIPQHSPKALIHGDVFFNNLIVEVDRLMAIIDFEEACYYFRSFDLGMTIIGTCRNGHGICFKKARRFISGYQNKLKLQPDEQKTLQAFTVYAAVATSFWRFRQYHVRKPESQFTNRHVEMQALADAIFEYPNSSFVELFTS